MRILWRILHEHGVEIVLTGHEHSYERFAPMGPNGEADPTTEVRNSDTWGVLKLSLVPSGYRWEFLPALGGGFRDSGSGSCR